MLYRISLNIAGRKLWSKCKLDAEEIGWGRLGGIHIAVSFAWWIYVAMKMVPKYLMGGGG